MASSSGSNYGGTGCGLVVGRIYSGRGCDLVTVEWAMVELYDPNWLVIILASK